MTHICSLVRLRPSKGSSLRPIKSKKKINKKHLKFIEPYLNNDQESDVCTTPASQEDQVENHELDTFKIGKIQTLLIYVHVDKKQEVKVTNNIISNFKRKDSIYEKLVHIRRERDEFDYVFNKPKSDFVMQSNSG